MMLTAKDAKPHARYNCQYCEYISDIHFKGDLTHLWTKTLDGKTKHYPLAYHPKLYITSDFIEEGQYTSSGKRSLEELTQLVMTLEDVISARAVRRYLSSKSEEIMPVLELEIYSMGRFFDVVATLKTQRINMFNCDINKRQQFFIDTESYPMGACHINLKDPEAGHISFDHPNPPSSWELESIIMYDNVRALDYPIPSFIITKIELDIVQKSTFPTYDDPLNSITLTTTKLRNDYQSTLTIEGKEKEILLQLVDELRNMDPDFIYMENGDKFSINYLGHRANYHSISKQFFLGRLDTPTYPTKDNSGQIYWTYGAILNRDPVKYVPGRIHLDYENSFMLHESGLEGLIDLCRISATPPERTSRASIGTILTGVEYVTSMSTIPPTLIPPNKPQGELYKPSDWLLIADSGGLIYPAIPGVYDRVWAIDFTSLYPMIMAKHNIGNETVLCSHADCKSKNLVPEVEYHVCDKQVGIVPRTMKLILEKRITLKLAKSMPIDEASRIRYAGIDSALKWILVCCLEGSTRVLVRKNGKVLTDRIDTIVNEFTEEDTLEALGIDEFGQPEFKPVKNVIKTRPKTPVYQIEFRGGMKITATGDHLWPVITNNGWKTVRTDQLTNDDWIPQLDKCDQEISYVELDLIDELSNRLTSQERQSWRVKNNELINILSDHLEGLEKFGNAPISFTRVVSVSQLEISPEYVYCFELDSPTPWFMIEGSLITHNCFGYLGFKNSRWGSIESHQCVTAYARRYLQQAAGICQDFGYEVICGIVDSLFIRKVDQDGEDDIGDLVYAISKEIGVPMDTEGRFQWVVFCNIKEFTDVAALNRYFGFFEHGEFKLRGIRTRQRRVTVMEREFQKEILDLLSQAKSTEEFEGLIPECYKMLRQWQKKLKNGEINAKNLIIKLKSHVGAGNYKSRTQQALVAQAYQEAGRTIEAGQNMHYIVRDDKRKNHLRVTIGPKVNENSRYDIDWYCDLLEDALLEIVEAPQRQFYGEVKYTSKGYVKKLDDWEEYEISSIEKRSYVAQKKVPVGLDGFFEID